MRAAPSPSVLVAAALVAGFALSSLLWERAGVAFQADTLNYFAQLLDPPLLQHQLFQSLWYLHAQPPLFNLIVGAALKVAPDRPGAPLHLVFLLAGLVTTGALFVALRELSSPRWLAIVLALAFVSTPTFVIYEHWCFYPHLELTFLAVAAAAFLRSRGRAGAAMNVAFAALGALALIRSLYHPVYLMGAGAAAAALARDRRATLLAAAPAVTVLLLLALKNLALFGFFGTSSWGGNSFHRMIHESLEPQQMRKMIRRGEISRLSEKWEFSPPEEYVALLAPEHPDTGIPALDETGKVFPSDNRVNYNHWVYPIASRAYLQNALRILTAHPEAYFRSVRWTSRRFLDPATDDNFLQPNRVAVWHAIVPFETAERSGLLRGGVAAALLWALVRFVRRRGPDHERLFLAFALGTVAWAGACGILLEFGENNRFRHHLAPLFFLVVILAARDVGGAVRRGFARGRRGAPSGPGGE